MQGFMAWLLLQVAEVDGEGNSSLKLWVACVVLVACLVLAGYVEAL